MQLVNFQIDSGFTSLIFQGKHLDLHNNFEFQQVAFDEIPLAAELIFAKRVAERVPETDPARLILRFRNVREYYQKDHAPDYPIECLDADASTIDMIGFSYEGEEIMDGVTDNTPRGNLPAMLLVFVTGRAKKIVADSVELIAD